MDDAIDQLRSGTSRLAGAAAAVRTTVVEDRPEDDQHDPDHKTLADLTEGLDDLVDTIAELGHLLDAPTVWGAGCTTAPDQLSRVHLLMATAGRVLRDDLLAVDGRYQRARRATAPWGAPWRSWAQVALVGLLECRDCLDATDRMLPVAWREISAVSTSAVSVHAVGLQLGPKEVQR